jgi:hypothetical protein
VRVEVIFSIFIMMVEHLGASWVYAWRAITRVTTSSSWIASKWAVNSASHCSLRKVDGEYAPLQERHKLHSYILVGRIGGGGGDVGAVAEVDVQAKPVDIFE